MTEMQADVVVVFCNYNSPKPKSVLLTVAHGIGLCTCELFVNTGHMVDLLSLNWRISVDDLLSMTGNDMANC